MGTKESPGIYDCYIAAAPNEPIFTLRANDALAPILVNMWAELRRQQIEQRLRPETDMGQVLEAKGCAEAMEIWRARNRPA